MICAFRRRPEAAVPKHGEIFVDPLLRIESLEMLLDMPPHSLPENPIQIVMTAKSEVRSFDWVPTTTDSMHVRPVQSDAAKRSAMGQIASQLYAYYLKPESLSNIEKAAHRFGVLIEHRASTRSLSRIEGSANFQIPRGLQEVLVENAEFLAVSGKRLQLRFAFSGDAPCLDTEQLRSATQWSGWLENIRLHPRSRPKKTEFPESKYLDDPTWRDGLSQERVLAYTTDATGCVRQLYLRIDALRD